MEYNLYLHETIINNEKIQLANQNTQQQTIANALTVAKPGGHYRQ